MNLWMHHIGTISPAAAPLTILTITAVTTTCFYGAALCVRAFIKRKTISFRFLMCEKAAFLAFGLTLGNSLCGTLMVYATPGTPEIMQALLTCSQIFWTLAGTILILRDERSLCHVLVVASFLFVAGGIILGAVPSLSKDTTSSDAIWWSLIFAGSMIPAALFNVLATMFMRSFTATTEDADAATAQR